MSLANLIAMQKAAKEAKESKGSGDETQGSVVDNGNPVAVAADPASDSAPVKPKLNFIGRKPNDSKAQVAVPATAGSAGVGGSGNGGLGNPKAGSLSLDDLANNEDSGDDSFDSDDRGEYAFPDEIPATAPTRDLPDDLSDSMKSFVTLLDGIYEIVHDPELFGNMIRTIMQEMQENPDYTKILADQDVHTMIRGLRSSMGLAKIKKAEKSTKTRAGAKKTPAVSAMAGTLDELFNADDF